MTIFFQTIQTNLELIGFKRGVPPFNKRQTWCFIEGSISSFLIYVYILHVAKSPKEYMAGIFLGAVGTLVEISHFSTNLKTKTMFVLIDEIEEVLVERFKYTELKQLYEKTNRQIEHVSKITHFVMVKISVPVIVLPKALLCYFLYFTTDLGANAFELSIPTWYPFDWRTPIGYLIATALQFIQITFGLHYFTCFITFAIGGTLIVLSIAKDIKSTLASIDAKAKSKRYRPQMMEEFCELIRFTSHRRVISYCTDIFQVTLVVMFLGCTGAICLAMLMIQIDISHYENDFVVVLASVFYGFWALNLVFAVCESIQRITDAFSDINDALGQLDWYLFPMEIQRLLITTTIFFQTPVEIAFFGSIQCSREQFKKVTKAGYSYFMVLREFYK